MLALHRGRTALTLACLLATAIGGAATHVPTADASFGQINSAFGGWGTGPGELDTPSGIAYRPATGRLYVADQYTDDNTGDPAFRIQRLDGSDGAPVDAGGLWVDDDYLNGWQGGLTYTGDIAVDPRDGQSHLYARLQPQGSDGVGGKVIEIDPDAPTANPSGAAPSPLSAFPIAAGKGTLNYARGLAVNPASGDVLVGDIASPDDDAPPIVRSFAAAPGHAAGPTIALADVDIAPTDTVHGARHVAVRAIAARADGTVAILSEAQETQRQGGQVVDAPAAPPSTLVDVYSPAGTHVTAFTLPKTAPTIAFAPDGNIAIPDEEQLGSIAEYNPSSATPATPARRFGSVTTDAAPAPCTFWGPAAALAGAGSDIFALDQRHLIGQDPQLRLVHLGDGGKGCGFKVHDATITVTGEPIFKGKPVTITGSAIDDGGPLDDSAFQWTIDGTAHTGRSFSYTFTSTGDKTISLKVDNGDAVATKTLSVHVSSTAPVAAFTAAGDGAAAPATVSFDASGSSDVDGPLADYRWDLDGDGSQDASGVRVSHTYASAGSYSVRLIVVDADGDQTTVRKTVTVAAPAVVVPPPIDQPKGGGDGGGGGVGQTPPNLGGASITPKPGKATISLGRALTVDAKGKFKVKLGCPAGSSGCSGTLTIVSAKAIASARGKAKKKFLTLATARYKVAAGGQTTITLTLSSAAKSALRKRKSVAIVATATGSDGSKTTVKGTVKAARKGKR